MPHRRRRQAGRSAPILVVTGLSREARCVGREGVETLCSGADPAFLRSALREKARSSYAAVVSFGLAGGLCPKLRPGDAVLGMRALGDAEAIEAHSELSDLIHHGFHGAGVHMRRGAVAGVDRPAMTVAGKAELRERRDAIVVDMESHIAGAFAQEKDLPFAIVRVACDPAERALPALAARAIKRDGGVDLPLVLRELAREPGQLARLIRAGLDSGAAFKTLRRCGPLLGPLFGLVSA